MNGLDIPIIRMALDRPIELDSTELEQKRLELRRQARDLFGVLVNISGEICVDYIPSEEGEQLPDGNVSRERVTSACDGVTLVEDSQEFGELKMIQTVSETKDAHGVWQEDPESDGYRVNLCKSEEELVELFTIMPIWDMELTTNLIPYFEDATHSEDSKIEQASTIINRMKADIQASGDETYST